MCRSNPLIKGEVYLLKKHKRTQMLSLLEKSEKLSSDQILHILSGQAMYEKFSENLLFTKGTFVPFNEAMCTGKTVSDVFSPEFIKMRAKSHQSTIEDYEKIVIQPLIPLLEEDWDVIVLWFGKDMFCQINLLTLLAYIEKNKNPQTVKVYLIDEYTYEVEEAAYQEVSYQKVYEQVIIDQKQPQENLIPELLQGIKLYLQDQQPENEITDYIYKYRYLPKEELLQRLFKQFPHYGLGDVQYLQLIDQVKKRS